MTAIIPVLVVEDESVILELLDVALGEAGYAVTLAQSGKNGMGLLDQHPGEYRALVTDIIMGAGKPTGWDVAKHARELNPDIVVVYMTGSEGPSWPVHGVVNSMLLSKPFAPAQIVAAVTQLLNANPQLAV
jgi:CheY-like chemotaxis protein